MQLLTQNNCAVLITKHQSPKLCQHFLLSRGSSLFPFICFLALRKVSSQEQASAVYEKRCDVFILWKIVEV